MSSEYLEINFYILNFVVSVPHFYKLLECHLLSFISNDGFHAKDKLNLEHFINI